MYCRVLALIARHLYFYHWDSFQTLWHDMYGRNSNRPLSIVETIITSKRGLQVQDFLGGSCSVFWCYVWKYVRVLYGIPVPCEGITPSLPSLRYVRDTPPPGGVSDSSMITFLSGSIAMSITPQRND